MVCNKSVGLSPLFFLNLLYSVKFKESPKSQNELKLNATNELLVNADDVNLLGK
jgi:hypothetical protein